MNTQGIKWSMDQAMIEDCGTFQTDDGESMAWAKAAYFGGLVSLKVTPEDLAKVAPHKGKIVVVSGKLHYEVKKGTGKETVRFGIDEIKPISGREMDTKGIIWSMDQAMIEDCGTFQTDDGESMAWAKAAYFGGLVSLKVTPEDLAKVAPHKGKIVVVSGKLHYEVKKGTGKETVRFGIDEIKPISGK